MEAEKKTRRLGAGRTRFKQVPDADEGGPVPLCARQRGCASAGCGGLVIREIHPVIPLELRMQRNIHQALKPPWASRLYLWDTCNRLFLEPVIPHPVFSYEVISYEAEPADPLRDQHRAIRQERNGPRLLEMLREDDDSQRSFLCRLDVERPAGQVGSRPCDRRWCVAGIQFMRCEGLLMPHSAGRRPKRRRKNDDR